MEILDNKRSHFCKCVLFVLTVADNTEKLDQRKSEDSKPREEIKKIHIICRVFWLVGFVRFFLNGMFFSLTERCNDFLLTS